MCVLNERPAAMGSGGAAAWVETPLALVMAVCASVSVSSVDCYFLCFKRCQWKCGCCGGIHSSPPRFRPFVIISPAADYVLRVFHPYTTISRTIFSPYTVAGQAAVSSYFSLSCFEF